jgi:hypothetical protein
MYYQYFTCICGTVLYGNFYVAGCYTGLFKEHPQPYTRIQRKYAYHKINEYFRAVINYVVRNPPPVHVKAALSW